jgi:small redox-active disulfide protein 2
MQIQILGTGCPKCKALTERVETAVREMGLECDIIKVTDIKDIMRYGVMMTPGLAIDGQVKSSGKLLSVEEIKSILEGA